MRNLFLFLLSFAVLQTTLAQNTFGPEHVLANSNGTGWCSYFDVDGDQINDFVQRIDEQVFWYKNLGNSNFEDAQTLTSISGLYPNQSDIDSDGDIDLVSGTNGYVVKCAINYGNGVFGEQIDLIVSPSYYYCFCVGDIDGDSDDDIIINQSGSTGHILLYSNNGDATFSNRVSVVTNYGYRGTSYKYVYLTDVDSDNDLDIHYAYSNGNNQWWPYDKFYFEVNEGHNNFSRIQIYQCETEDQRKFKDADITGDGFTDLIVYNGNGGKYLTINNGSNQFNITHLIAFSIDYLIYFDPDSDNDKDFFYLNSSNFTVWRENIDNGALAGETSLCSNGGYNVPGDVDLDGDLDLIISGDSLITWIENITNATGYPDVDIHKAKIFPNPANDFIFITSEIKVGLTQIVSSSGQVLIHTNELKIDVSSLTMGIYIVRILDENGNTITTKKLIIRR